MERETQHEAVLVELGAATRETKGPVGFEKDDALGIPGAGLSDD